MSRKPKSDPGPDNPNNVFRGGKTPAQAYLDSCPLRLVVKLVRHRPKIEYRKVSRFSALPPREKEVGAYLTLRLSCDHEVTMLQDGHPGRLVEYARAQLGKVELRCPVCGPG